MWMGGFYNYTHRIIFTELLFSSTMLSPVLDHRMEASSLGTARVSTATYTETNVVIVVDPPPPPSPCLLERVLGHSALSVARAGLNRFLARVPYLPGRKRSYQALASPVTGRSPPLLSGAVRLHSARRPRGGGGTQRTARSLARQRTSRISQPAPGRQAGSRGNGAWLIITVTALRPCAPCTTIHQSSWPESYVYTWYVHT